MRASCASLNRALVVAVFFMQHASPMIASPDPLATARLLRLHDRPAEGSALLEPLVREPGASSEIVEEYVMCSGTPVLGNDAFEAMMSDLDERFGDRAALHALRSLAVEPDDPPAALEEAELGLSLFPDSIALASRKAVLLLQREDPDSTANALMWLAAFDASHPLQDIIQYWLGEAYAQSPARISDSVERALDAYWCASELNPAWARPRLGAAGVLMLQGRFSEAYRECVAAEQLAPNLLAVREQKYRAALSVTPPPITVGQITSEVESAVRARGNDLAGLDFASRVYELMKDTGRQSAAQRALTQHFPASISAFRIRMDDVQRLEEAGKVEEAVELATETARRSTDPRQATIAYGVLAGMLARSEQEQQLGHVVEEWAAAIEAADLGKQASYTYTIIARWYARLGGYEKAVRWAERALSGGERMVGGLSDAVARALEETLASAYFESGRFDQARPHIEKMVGFDPGNPRWHAMLGKIAMEERTWEQARREMESSYRLSFMNAEAEGDLRRLYEAESGSPEGWESYIGRARQKTTEELRRAVLESCRVEPRALPDMKLPLFGTERRLSNRNFSGKAVVMNLWASWCAPCRIELPPLQSYYEKHRSDPGVAVYAVNVEESVAQVREFLTGRRFTVPILLDSQAWDRFGVSSIPATFVADQNGRVRFILSDFNPRADYVKILEWLVEAASSP